MYYKILVLLLIGGLVWTPKLGNEQENTPPQVAITLPGDPSRFSWNTLIPYTIHIADLEDGTTEYQEIPENEVFMIVAHARNEAQLKNFQNPTSKEHLLPLSWMGRANCFNCHRVKGKLIGPSFEQIATRYRKQSHAMDSLIKNIVVGSKGRWGDQEMPAQTPLDSNRVKDMVQWILNYGMKTEYQIYPGTEGAFRTEEKPENNSKNSQYQLTAFYTDHGQNGISGSSKIGMDSLVLYPIME